MIIIEILFNLAMLVSVSVVSGFIDNRWPRNTTAGKVLQGFLFGFVALLGMINPFVLTKGIIFDGRSVVLSLCSLFFGPVSGSIAAIMTLFYRIVTGGPGMLMGILVIITSTMIGLLGYHSRFRFKIAEKALYLYMFGVLVHLAMVACIFAIPYAMRRITFENLTLTILGVYPVATALIGKILKDQMDSAGRKRAEMALIESEERLKLALLGSRQGFWDWDLMTNEIKRDEGWAAMLGYSLSEIQTMEDPWKQLLHPDDATAALDSIKMHLTGDTPHYNIEYRMCHRDGTYRWILDQAQIVKYNLDGKPIRMSGTHTDITDLKTTEQKLRDKARELENFNRLMLGREMKMIELKKEVNQLLKETGKDEKYNIPG